VTRKISIPDQLIRNTSEFVYVINELLKTYVDNNQIRLKYNVFNKTYEFYSLNGTNFIIDFNTSINIGSLIGFKNTILSNSNRYVGEPVDSIEDTTKPSNIYICSDLVDSIDSGCIVP
jgi:hypothetical protein